MKITHWFPTALGEANMPTAYKEYEKLLPHIQKIKKGTDNCFYYYQIHKDKKFNTLNKWIFEKVQEFSNVHRFGKIKYEDSWFNDYKMFHANTPHVHNGSVFTAVYYLTGSMEDKSSMVIHSPVPSDMMNPRRMTPADPQRNLTDLTAEDIVITPSTGYLCIFRSYLWHEVPVKRNKLPRISLAYTFNV